MILTICDRKASLVFQREVQALAALWPAFTLMLCASAKAADLDCSAPQTVDYIKYTVQDFTIPLTNPSGLLNLSVYGGDGGGAVIGGNSQCSEPGGQGATATGSFPIGSGNEELQPGGTIRFIIGQLGGTNVSSLPTGGTGGGGGGGSAVLYRAPGVSGDLCPGDWKLLLAAGAGGGGYQGIFAGACIDGHTGKNAETGECGSKGGGSAGGDGGCGGNNGQTISGKGGQGAFEGCPAGDFGSAAQEGNGHGAWGFGGGGGSGRNVFNFEGAGGGGGYSGGGGGVGGREGGGGGSYVSPWAYFGSVDAGSPLSNYGGGGYECAPPNNTCYQYLPVGVGTTAFNSEGANPWQSPCGFLDENTGLWFSYVSQCGGTTTIDTVGSSYDTTLSIQQVCEGSPVGCNDDAPGIEPWSELTLETLPNSTHYIMVGGYNGASGPGQLNITSALDLDGDATCNDVDNCPNTANSDQADSDSDGVGDACDACPGYDDLSDADGDGLADGCDLCPNAADPDQADDDLDGIGDACDVCVGYNTADDADGDGIPDACDLCGNFDDTIDCDGNGVPDLCELSRIGRYETLTTSDYVTLNGTATLDNGSVRLTEATTNQVGSVVFEPVSDIPVDAFTVEYSFRMGGGGGADGMSFALMDADTTGSDHLFGESENAGPLPLVLSFDTYNGGAANGNHVILHNNGAVMASYLMPYPLDDGTWQRVRFTFDRPLASLLMFDALGNATSVFNNVAVPGYTPVRARYGFGGRTGGVTNEHRVDSVLFQVLDADNDCNMNNMPDLCDADADGDGVPDDCDVCAGDDATGDTDTDGQCDDLDGCPNDPDKIEPGQCGCGVSDADADNDGIVQCLDCDDNDDQVFPGQSETLCDDIDNDCDASTEDNPSDACTVNNVVMQAEGPRYLQVTPADGAVPIALKLTSEDAPCLVQYIDLDPSTELAAEGLALLVDSPVYRTPGEWGTLHVRSFDIAPGQRYTVRPEVENVGEIAEAVTFVTHDHGDVDNNGIANFADIQLVVLEFQKAFDGPLGAVDLAPCMPNAIVNFGDIQQAVFAFQQQSFDVICPQLCAGGAAKMSEVEPPTTAELEMRVSRMQSRKGERWRVDVWTIGAKNIHTFQVAMNATNEDGYTSAPIDMWIAEDAAAFALSGKSMVAASDPDRSVIGAASLDGQAALEPRQATYLATFLFETDESARTQFHFDKEGTLLLDGHGRRIPLVLPKRTIESPTKYKSRPTRPEPSRLRSTE